MKSSTPTHPSRGDENPPPYRGTGPGNNGDNIGKPGKEQPAAEPESPPPRAPPDIPRCNLLNISRPKEGIRGEYVVDPSVSVPDTLLAPLPDELQLDGARPNLRLASNQSVEADVWVLPVNAPPGETVRLVFISRDAHLKIRIVRTVCGIESTCDSRELRMLALHHHTGTSRCLIEARSGRNITLTLPRDFVGVVKTSTSFGPAVMPVTFATLSEVEGEGKYFKGDLARLGENDWQGSTIEIVAPVGKIRVTLAEDEVPSECIVS